MKTKTIYSGTCALLWLVGQTTQAQDTASACRALANLSFAETVEIVAEMIPAGEYTTPNSGPRVITADVPAFCRVAGLIEPAIRFEVWLPQPAAWNGRFQAVGGGGFAGVISYGAMIPNIQQGYVTASTDTGHVAGELDWLSDEGRLRDYGYRAIHEMTVKSKQVLQAYYARSANYNYFNGCSTGGRQGLMEAQRFADDYDGIVTGAPVNYFIATHYTQLWVALAAKPVSDTLLNPADLNVVNQAVLAQCDATDGVEDGVLNDPPSCDFDPGVLQCASGGSGQCLSAEQVTALRKIYQGPANPKTGEALHPGLVPGGELTWSLVGGSELASIPDEYFGRSVFGDTDWDWRHFDFDQDIRLAADKTAGVLDATDPDLSKFRDRDGKLILYHGWNDQVIFPAGTIGYYEDVAAKLESTPGRGIDETRDFFRLFMVPGMTHCRGGPGANRFDAQAAIEAWVERGEAPAQIEASKTEDGATLFTRPLCPYPQTAQFTGNGDSSRSANFVCME